MVAGWVLLPCRPWRRVPGRNCLGIQQPGAHHSGGMGEAVISADQLAAWRKLAEEATEGPWRLDSAKRFEFREPDDPGDQALVGGDDTCPGIVWEHGPTGTANAAFIAAARTAVPALLDEVERLGALLTGNAPP